MNYYQIILKERLTRNGVVPNTWGGALNLRIQGQNGSWPTNNPNGTFTNPNITPN